MQFGRYQLSIVGRFMEMIGFKSGMNKEECWMMGMKMTKSDTT